MIYEINGYFGNRVSVKPRIELYLVKDPIMGQKLPGLAVILDEPHEGAGEQYAVLTVSFGEHIGIKNAAYIDVNNCPFANQLLAEGIAVDTGFTKNSGFCSYPLWVFNENFLKEHGAENYEKYSEAFDAYQRNFVFDEVNVEDEDLNMGGM